MMKRSVVLFALFAACATEPDPGEEPTTTTAQALVEGPACERGEGKWLNEWTSSDPKCDGGWEWHAKGSCPSSACGCQTAQACNNWHFGAGAIASQTFANHIDIPSHEECTCDVVGSPPGAIETCPHGHTTCEVVYDPEDIPAVCNIWQAADAPVKVQARKNLIDSAMTADGIAGSHASTLAQVVATGATYTIDGESTATCRYTVKYPTEGSGTDPAYCPVCAVYKSCQNASCADLPASLWSEPGKRKTELLAAQGGANVVGAVKCSTCEQETTPAARYTCLNEMRAKGPPLATISAIDRTKLLVYEWFGMNLDDPQRTDAKLTYKTAPEPACGRRLPTTCNLGAVVTDPVIRAKLVRCTRLLGDHVSNGLAALEFQDCLDVPQTTFAAIQAACPALLGDLDGAEETLWQKQLAIPLPISSIRVAQLAEQLRRLDLWRDVNGRLENARHPGGMPESLMRLDTERVLGAWWSALYARYGVTAGPLEVLSDENLTEEQRKLLLEQKLDLSRSRGVQASQDLTTALFTRVNGALPLDSFDLFMPLFGDGIATLEHQIAELSTYHDFACLFSACAESPSNLVSANRLLARIERGQDLQGAVEAIPQSQTLAGWRPVFAQVVAERAQTVPLDLAWNDYQAERDVNLVDPPARPAVRTIAEAQTRDARFLATGQLSPAPTFLNAGQSQDQLAQLATVMQGRVDDLHAMRTELFDQLVNLAREQIGYVDAGTQQASIQKTREKLAQEMDDHVNDIAGLQASATEADLGFATIVESFKAIEHGLDQSQLLRNDSSKRFQVSGRDAHFTGDAKPAAIDVAAGRFDVDAGQVLQVGVSGQYQPTCALKTTKFLGQNGLTAGADLSTAFTGPDGYGLVWTGSSYKAMSTVDAQKSYIGGGMKSEVCAGTPGAVTAVSGVDAKGCLHWEAGLELSHTSTDATGHDDRTAASFNVGLRLKGTPFEDMPAGALLLVTTSRTSGETLGVQIARTGVTTVVPPENATVRFVVNDKACSDANATELTVTAGRMVTVGQASADVVQAMAEVLDLQKLKLDQYVAQGQVLAGQLAAMRSDAYLKLNGKLGPHGFSADLLPPALLGLFNAFLDREVVRVERAVQILDIERKVALLKIDLASIDATLVSGAATAHLREVLLARLLGAIDEAALRDAAARLLGRSRDYLYPALKIWYPAELAALTSDPLIKQNLAKLSSQVSLDPAVSPTELVAPIEIVVGRLLDLIEDGTYAPVPDGHRKIVRVSFPKPALIEPNPITGSFLSASRIVDGPRAAAVWGAILSSDPEVRKRVPVTVLPDDIYSTGLSGQGTLGCNMTSPVVRRLGFYFGARNGTAYPNSESLNQLGRYLGGATPKLQQFLTQAGIFELMLAPGSGYGTLAHASVFYGITALADTVLTSPNSQSSLSGMSPFGTMYLDFNSALTSWTGAFPTGIPEAEELVVVMEVDSAQTGGPPPGVARCADYQAPLTAR